MTMEPYDEEGLLLMEPVDIWLEGPEERVSVQLVCGKCGGKAFNVWQGDYFTGIACVDCKTPVGVHSG